MFAYKLKIFLQKCIATLISLFLLSSCNKDIVRRSEPVENITSATAIAKTDIDNVLDFHIRETQRLLKELILENDSMKNQLLISYLPGMPIKQFHNDLPPCSSPNQLDCFLSWRTLAEGYSPPGDWELSDSISCVNPISWQSDNLLSKKEEHLGILFQNHKIHYPNSIETYTDKGVLWIKPIKIPFARFYKMKNYHIADYNLYWINIRNNLRYRLKENSHN